MAASSDYISKTKVSDLEVQSHRLLLLIAQQDQQAFIELYRLYKQPLFNFIFRMIHDRVGAEDVLQEVFLAIWNGSKRFKGRSKVNTWIYRIAYNQSVSWLRRHRTVVAFDSVQEIPDEDLAWTGKWDDTENLARALDRLSTKQRAVIELAFMNGMSYQEISRILGIPVGTVKSRMCYGLKNLSEWLNET